MNVRAHCVLGHLLICIIVPRFRTPYRWFNRIFATRRRFPVEIAIVDPGLYAIWKLERQP